MIGFARRPMPRPGLAWGPYPQRRAPVSGPGGAAALRRTLAVGRAHASRLVEPWHRWRLDRFGMQVERAAAAMAARKEPARSNDMVALRASLASGRWPEDMLVELFAMLADTSRRHLNVSPYRSQIIAARIMMDDRLAEMATGEGKTLAIGLAAAAAAMSGVPVHVITANDYLVERDHALLAPLYDALQLSSGIVIATTDAESRRVAYAADIIYVTAREVAFDYLRDRLAVGLADFEQDWHVRALQRPQRAATATLMRGLCMAIVDEADSQLLDEAVTPLILAQSRCDERLHTCCRESWTAAGLLWVNRDFVLLRARRRAELTDAGLLRVRASSSGDLQPDDQRALIETALGAMHLMQRDVDYLVSDGKVTPIDEPTGRVAHGRQWSRGLQQMIEIKEGLKLSDPQQTVARIDFQTLFARYIRLSGMSGSLSDARGELAAIYRLAVWPVSPRLRSRRRIHAPVLFASCIARWQAAIAIVEDAHAAGRPVLLSTESVTQADELSALLLVANLTHRVLHAARADGEARILRQAGDSHAITVATNIAGRGADILIDEVARAAGGLLVIVCHTNRERRLDRQIFGRCARTGQPGEVIRLAALTDDTLRRHLPPWVVAVALRSADRDQRLPRPLAVLLISWAQTLAQARQRRTRLQLIETTRHNERLLAMAGPGE